MTAQADDVELTILMPCLNEAETLAVCIEKALSFLEDEGIVGEVVIADNGSADGSQEIASAAGARLVNVPVRGYGAALLGGIEAARGKFVIMGDADDSYDFGSLLPYVEQLRDGADLVMGNRFRGGIAPGAMPFLHRYLGNPVLSTIGRIFFKSGIGDFHCGLRGFKRDSMRELNLQTTGMEFASEMVVKATLHKLRIEEVPTTLSPDGRSRPPHLRTWSDGWRHLRFLLLYSPRWLFLYPGIATIAVSLALGAWILPGPRTVGSVVLDVHTLVFVYAGILIGSQAVYFAFVTKIYGIGIGILPPDPRLTRAFNWFTLETGLVAGLLVFLAGVGLSVGAVWMWARGSFGEVDPTSMLRIVLPGSLCLALGLQLILSSFFLSALGLRTKGGTPV